MKSGDHRPSSDVRPRPRWARTILLIVLFGIAAGGVGWATASVLTPADDPLEAVDYTHVQVKPGEVGATIMLNAVAKWTPAPVGASRASGVVTEVSTQPGDEVSQGDVLFRVDQHPISIAEGDIPAYRAIGAADEGPDVAQLQRMLQSLGHYGGAIDGSAGTRTVAAVRAWQRALGVDQSGTVGIADIIYVPHLPTRVSLDSEVIARGRIVTGGELVVRAMPASPEFSVPVTEAQAAMVPSGTRVEITSPEGDQWLALASRQVTDPQSGTVNITLETANGTSICADECSQVPVTGEALLSAVIVTIEQVSGLVVPSAALVTTADAQTIVVDQNGKRIDVTVVASARGMSVIEGVEAGVHVRVPGSEADQ